MKKRPAGTDLDFFFIFLGGKEIYNFSVI